MFESGRAKNVRSPKVLNVSSFSSSMLRKEGIVIEVLRGQADSNASQCRF